MTLVEQFLAKYGPEVKTREGNNLRFQCPVCGQNSLSCHITKGLVNCFHCGYGKGVRFDGETSIEEDEAPIDYLLHEEVINYIVQESNLSSDHKDYLVHRGIYSPAKYSICSVPLRVQKLLKDKFTEDQLVSSGFYYKSASGLVLTKALGLQRIIIPHWHGSKIIGIKTRTRPSIDVLDDGPKYLSPKGSRVGSFVWYKNITGTDLVITEGELAAIAANEIHIPCVGIPGLSGTKNHKIVAQLNNITSQYGIKRVFIILDTDPEIANNPYKIQNALSLSKGLKQENVIIYLPQDSSEECMDLDLFLSRNDYDDLYNLMEDFWPKRYAIFKGLTKRVQRLLHERSRPSESV